MGGTQPGVNTVLRAIAHCGPLCLDKATKIFFSTSPGPAPQNMTWQELARQKNLCERLKPFERYVLLFFSSQHVFLKQQFYSISHCKANRWFNLVLQVTFFHSQKLHEFVIEYLMNLST